MISIRVAIGQRTARATTNRFSNIREATRSAIALAKASERDANLLPLYDVRELRLSRYALSGPIDARLRLSDPQGVTLTDAKVVIPGDDAYPLAFEGETRWVTAYATSRLRKMGSDPLAVRPLDATVPLRLVLSRVSYPVRNVVTAACLSSLAADPRIYGRHGRTHMRFVGGLPSALQFDVEAPREGVCQLAGPGLGLGRVPHQQRLTDGAHVRPRQADQPLVVGRQRLPHHPGVAALPRGRPGFAQQFAQAQVALAILDDEQQARGGLARLFGLHPYVGRDDGLKPLFARR